MGNRTIAFALFSTGLSLGKLREWMGVVGYAEDSTVLERYFSSARASRDETTALREAMVERMSLTLNLVSSLSLQDYQTHCRIPFTLG